MKLAKASAIPSTNDPVSRHPDMLLGDELARSFRLLTLSFWWILVMRIFPSRASCLRLVLAPTVETHEDWLDRPRYLNAEHLHEHRRQQVQAAA
jgi:hypothetical protein